MMHNQGQETGQMSPEATSNVGPEFGEELIKEAQRGMEDRVAQGFDAQVAPAGTGLPFPRRWGCSHPRLRSLRTFTRFSV